MFHSFVYRLWQNSLWSVVFLSGNDATNECTVILFMWKLPSLSLLPVHVKVFQRSSVVKDDLSQHLEVWNFLVTICMADHSKQSAACHKLCNWILRQTCTSYNAAFIETNRWQTACWICWTALLKGRLMLQHHWRNPIREIVGRLHYHTHSSFCMAGWHNESGGHSRAVSSSCQCQNYL